MSLMTLLAAGGKALLAAAGDLEGEFDTFTDTVVQVLFLLTGLPWETFSSVSSFAWPWCSSSCVSSTIPKAAAATIFFTFMLVSISVFMLIFFLGGTKLKTGVALGLFAIFSIIRYRTESVPIREMNYLFVLIAISVINGVGPSFSFVELLAADVLLIIVISICESTIFVKKEASKLIKYDNVKLVTPDKNEELLEDLKRRTGLEVFRVEVGAIDFLKDSAILRIYYKPLSGIDNSVDSVGRMPRG